MTETDLKYVDCYVHSKMGLFIPSVVECQQANKLFNAHPSYIFIILFSLESITIKPTIQIKESHYLATVIPPNTSYNDLDKSFTHYYCIIIDKDYFEEQYKKYTGEKPDFHTKQFAICHDILKTLNTFAFEYSKKMQNADITLRPQITIVTHWLIRSILGENYE